jgi:uncharacterized membrane protein
MFDIQLLSQNPETPSFYVILISALFAFFLSSLIAITYEYTTQSIYKKNHFLQSLVLIGIVAATVMQAIGDSLARGLGMIGALSVIRFRTELNDPRNITFMFASLAVGIATGVLGFGIAMTGTLVFCLAAIILRFSPLSNGTELIGDIKLQVPKNDRMQAIIEKALKKQCSNFELNQIRFLSPKRVKSITDEGIPVLEEISRENIQEFNYLVRLKNAATIQGLTNTLAEIEGLEELKLSFDKQATKL